MKKLVSVLMMSSIANLAHAWTDASINYFQPIAAYEAQNGADTNSSKNSNKAPNHKIQNDFNVVTNIGESYPDERHLVSQSEADMRTFDNIMKNDELYAMLSMLNKDASEEANAAQFVMLIREMHRMNQNLEKIIRLTSFHAQKGSKNDE